MWSLLLCLLVAVAGANPLQTRGMSANQQLALNVMMTIEYIESGFFNAACNRFNDFNFTNEGYPAAAYAQVCSIAQDKQAAVQHIGDILSSHGVSPPAPCLYVFPVGDVSSWLLESYMLSATSLGACVESIAIYEQAATEVPPTLANLCSAITQQVTFLRETGGACPLEFPATQQPLTLKWAYNLALPWIQYCQAAPLLTELPPLIWGGPIPGPKLFPPIQPGTFISFQFEPADFLTPVDPGTPLYLALGSQALTAPATFVDMHVSKADPDALTTGEVLIPPGEGVNGTMFACLTTFSGGLNMQELSDFGTLAGPAILLLS